MTITCRACGVSFDPGLSEEKEVALDEGYSVTVCCPDPQCQNHHGGLVSKPDK